jgi:predicted ArsR family transcriptional regulator
MTDRVELTDPKALRAYAHPIRMALLGLLRREGPRTATQAAAEIGESVASCSFHLRQLAKYGLVEEVTGVRGRAKPWRATARYTSWRSDSEDPEIAAAATELERSVLDQYHRRAAAWLDRRASEPAVWRRAGQSSDYLVHLTAAETRRLTQRLAAIVEEFTPRNDDPALRPDGSRPVHLIHLVVPLGQSTPEGSA